MRFYNKTELVYEPKDSGEIHPIIQMQDRYDYQAIQRKHGMLIIRGELNNFKSKLTQIL